MKFSKHFLLFFAFSWCFFLAGSDLLAQKKAPTLPRIALKPFASGFDSITDIVSTGDARLFVVEQKGYIRIIDGAGNVMPTPFLNITNLVTTVGNEQGLLGLVFHPNYASNGYFYVNYTAPGGPFGNGITNISRFRVSPSNPNLADPASEFIVLSVDQPFRNHNAGDLNFGPDGYLYIPLGDGGNAFDPFGNAQNPQTLLGKMLRIDVNNGSPYAIPADNPYVNDPNVLDEIWASGLRNPYRFSFDRQTGDMWIGDVGQNIWEEIDFEPASSNGGSNWGWDCFEGNAQVPAENSSPTCGAASNYDFPVFTYLTDDGCAVQGGFVYRGNDYPAMKGHYIFTDFCSGKFRTLYPNGSGGFNHTEQLRFTQFDFTTFGEDQRGELYVGGRGGIVYRVTDASCKNNNIQLCHRQGNKTSTICITFDSATVATHLAHGDVLGACSNGNTRISAAGQSETPDLLNAQPEFMAYPNPLSDQTHISFTLSRAEKVQLEILDATGRVVQQLFQGNAEKGKPVEVTFKASDLPGGLYVARLKTNSGIYFQKLLVNK